MTEVSVGELFVRLIISLGVVVGIMALAAAGLRRLSGAKSSIRRQGKPVPVEVVARQALGRRASLAVVRAGNRGFVVGVTDHSVTLLAETSADELVIETPGTVSSVDTTSTASTWRNITEQLRERTVRRS